MQHLRTTDSTFFDKGVSLVTTRHEDAIQSLPPRQELTPTDYDDRAMLDRVLALPDMASYLDSAIRPTVGDRSLLSPGRFRNVLESAAQSLAQASRKTGVQTPSTQALNKANRLLLEEMGLRDLLGMYRSLVYQG